MGVSAVLRCMVVNRKCQGPAHILDLKETIDIPTLSQGPLLRDVVVLFLDDLQDHRQDEKRDELGEYLNVRSTMYGIVQIQIKSRDFGCLG